MKLRDLHNNALLLPDNPQDELTLHFTCMEENRLVLIHPNGQQVHVTVKVLENAFKVYASIPNGIKQHGNAYIELRYNAPCSARCLNAKTE